jgi:hypothetical protein
MPCVAALEIEIRDATKRRPVSGWLIDRAEFDEMCREIGNAHRLWPVWVRGGSAVWYMGRSIPPNLIIAKIPVFPRENTNTPID